MNRLLFRAAAAFVCALTVSGCAGLGDSDNAASQTAGETTDQAAANGPYAALVSKLPTDLDGEIRRAQLLRASGDFKGATHALSQLMLAAPDDPRVVGEYGKVLAQENRTADALAFLDRAIELQPDNWTLYSALGVAYDQSDDRAKAAAAYKHALALKPDEPAVLNNYAMSRMLAGDLDGADELLHQAAAHGGGDPKIANNLAMIGEMRAKSGQAAGQPGSAIKPAPAAIVAKAAAQPAKPRDLQHRPAPDLMKKPAPRVVMQKVPYDPLAGKIYGSHKAATPHRVAKTEHKDAAKPAAQTAAAKTGGKSKPHGKSSTPSLRTAADIY